MIESPPNELERCRKKKNYKGTDVFFFFPIIYRCKTQSSHLFQKRLCRHICLRSCPGFTCMLSSSLPFPLSPTAGLNNEALLSHRYAHLPLIFQLHRTSAVVSQPLSIVTSCTWKTKVHRLQGRGEEDGCSYCAVVQSPKQAKGFITHWTQYCIPQVFMFF